MRSTGGWFIGGVLTGTPSRLATAAALLILSSAYARGAIKLIPGAANIGRDLQTAVTVALSEPTPADLKLTLTSGDPSRLLLSPRPDVAGTPSITITVKTRFRESPEFWLHALRDSGVVNYTASADQVESASGAVTLSPSGVIMIGPMGENAPVLMTTPRGWPAKIKFQSARLDESLNMAELQYVRGGYVLKFGATSSDTAVGKITPGELEIEGASDTVVAQFSPASPGTTTLSVSAPGLKTPARLNEVLATVKMPGIGVGDDIVVGQNLQAGAALNLGEPAPEGGVTVTLTSADPKKLVLAAAAQDAGQPFIRIHVPAGKSNATYYLQGLGREGTVTHTATAPGYTQRTGTLTLAPSGVILSLDTHGPPDEAELFRPQTAGGPQNGFFAHLKEQKSTPLVLFTAYLDPATHRSADITVQQLRGGLTLPVDLSNSHPEVAAVQEKVIIKGGSDRVIMPFKPSATGQTLISVATPPGFTKPSNSTELLAIVRE
jgi:hypothetical protein